MRSHNNANHYGFVTIARFAGLVAMICASAVAHASIITDYVSSFNSTENLSHRNILALNTCDAILNQWQGPEYSQSIQEAARLRSGAATEAIDTFLSLCEERYRQVFHIDKTRHQKVSKRQQLLSEMAEMDLFRLAHDLPEQIRLELDLLPERSKSVPPAPFELLSGIASSDSQLEESLQAASRKGFSEFIFDATGTALGIKLLYDVVRPSATKGSGCFTRSLILGGLMTWAAEQAVEKGQWLYHRQDLETQILKIQSQLQAAPVGSKEFDYLLEQYFQINLKLGYLLAAPLFLFDESESETPVLAPGENGATTEALWSGAANYLRGPWAQSAMTSIYVERFESHAAHAHEFYATTPKSEAQGLPSEVILVAGVVAAYCPGAKLKTATQPKSRQKFAEAILERWKAEDPHAGRILSPRPALSESSSNQEVIRRAVKEGFRLWGR